MAVTRVIGVVVDTKVLTVYKADGKTVEVPQGDPRVSAILDALPQIEQQGFAMIELEASNPYRDFEQKSGGLVRFFKVAKKKVAGLFGGDEVPVVSPRKVGRVSPDDTDDTLDLTEQVSKPLSQAEAVADIMKNAQPVGNGNSEESEPEVRDDETIVAITEGKAIPHQEKVKEHIRHHGGKAGSAIGLENFYRRITPIIDKRGHSVEDLLRFMEKNDLPIADDGCLIVYKVLAKRNGVYVDCHTKNVKQRIGSFVCMDEKLVDPNRREECSNGLHVARRGYIGGFSGDACTIVKVAPEDVIAVPDYDANKVRVCGYHILMELEHDAWRLLQQNRPMTENPKAQKMLARAISGDHIGRIETVRIGGQRGTNIEITPIEKSQQHDAPKPKVGAVEPAKALDHDHGGEVDTKKTTAQAAAIIKTGSATQALSRQEQAKVLLTVIQTSTDVAHISKAAQELLALKRASKVSWATLGVGEADSKKVLDLTIDTPAPAPVQEEVRVIETPAPVEQPAATDAAPVRKVPTRPTGYRAQRIGNLVTILNDKASSDEARVKAARELLDIRRETRKSWAKLNFPELNDQYLRVIVNANIDLAPPKGAATLPPATEKAIKATKVAGEQSKAKKAAKPLPAPTGSRKEQARTYFDRRDWVSLSALKKKAKMSWTALGFSNKEVDEIKLHLGEG